MKHEIAKRTVGGALAETLSDEDYYYQRVERMRQFKKDDSLALSHDIIKREDGTYALVPLSEAKRVMSDKDGDHNRSVASSRGFSGAIGFDRAPNRGKYNDEGRLALSECVTVDVGEISAFSTM